MWPSMAVAYTVPKYGSACIHSTQVWQCTYTQYPSMAVHVYTVPKYGSACIHSTQVWQCTYTQYPSMAVHAYTVPKYGSAHIHSTQVWQCMYTQYPSMAVHVYTVPCRFLLHVATALLHHSRPPSLCDKICPCGDSFHFPHYHITDALYLNTDPYATSHGYKERNPFNGTCQCILTSS